LDCKPTEFLKEIVQFGLSDVFPTSTTVLRIFISLPVSVALLERTSNLLKQVKNYYRSTMGQYRLNCFATLSINCDLARKLGIFSVISEVSEKRARKAFVK
jgi:hypothetical protein